jgi:hypothetical protein
VEGQWFSPGTPVSSTNKTESHDIAEILFESGIKQYNPNSNPNICIFVRKLERLL